jgi:DNA-directed RNA polymerase specialized sigma24 family protein
MTRSGAEADEGHGAFDRRLGEVRPKLHRCCARMTGSVSDGEDVVQEPLMKAINARHAAPISTNRHFASLTTRRWIARTDGGARRPSIPMRR